MRKILKGNLDCIGCPNYHVTKNGKVYSNYKGKGWVKLSLNRIKNNGYVIVSIRDTNGYRYTYNIHQLVALVYVPNPNNHKYVCHKDNIRTHIRTYIGVLLRKILNNVLEMVGLNFQIQS